MNDMKVGLVLSGGGAKGAYQVGVIKALHEMGTRVDAVAGASIGALNGAILAAAPSLQEGYARLEKLWIELAEFSPLKFKLPAYIGLLAAAGLSLNGLSTLTSIANQARTLAGRALPNWLNERFLLLDQLNSGVLSDTPLQRHMENYLEQSSLNRGLPLYLSVFRSREALADLLHWLIVADFIDTPKSEFIHIQSLPLADQKDAILASAAIPLLYAPKKINDTLYSDGGQGGSQKMQGNTPITPLLQAGYKMIIVTHLSDASLWSRHDFPEAVIVEIRPEMNISRDGGVRDMLGFDANKISSWIEQGYLDTLRCMGRVKTPLQARSRHRDSERAIEHRLTDGNKSCQKLKQAMASMTIVELIETNDRIG